MYFVYAIVFIPETHVYAIQDDITVISGVFLMKNWANAKTGEMSNELTITFRS